MEMTIIKAQVIQNAVNQLISDNKDIEDRKLISELLTGFYHLVSVNIISKYMFENELNERSSKSMIEEIFELDNNFVINEINSTLNILTKYAKPALNFLSVNNLDNLKDMDIESIIFCIKLNRINDYRINYTVEEFLNESIVEKGYLIKESTYQATLDFMYINNILKLIKKDITVLDKFRTFINNGLFTY